MTAALLSLFCVLCYTGQNFFSKLFSVHYRGPAPAATPVFAIVYGLFTSAATFCCGGFSFSAAPAAWYLGILNGLVLFLFNLGAINASRTGPYAFQSILMLFGNILLPLGFTALYWGDRLGGLKLAGILVMLLSFLLFNRKGLRFEGVKKGYFLWVGLLFLTNGLYGIVLDAQQRLLMQTQRNEMIMITFLCSALISGAYLPFAMKGSSLGSAFGMGKKTGPLPWAAACAPRRR